MVRATTQDRGGFAPAHDGSEESDAFCRAVELAIDETGLESVTQDDIVRHSGIARTTLYRRYGSRDAVLATFLRQRLSADIAECRRLAMASAPIDQRFEHMIVYCVLAANRHAWLQRELDRGLSPATLDLIAGAMKEASHQSLIPLLADARAEGLCACPAPLDELQRWLLLQIFELSRRRYPTVEEAQRIVRTYIMPVLAFTPIRSTLEDKIDAIFRHIIEQPLSEI